MMLKRHWKRSQRARDIDHSKRARRTFSPDNPRGRRLWYQHPNRYDMRGLDNPGAKEYYQVPDWDAYWAAVKDRFKKARGTSTHRQMQQRMGGSNVYEKQMITRITGTTSLNYLQVKHLLNMDPEDQIGDIETMIKEAAAGFSNPREAYERAKKRIKKRLKGIDGIPTIDVEALMESYRRGTL